MYPHFSRFSRFSRSSGNPERSSVNTAVEITEYSTRQWNGNSKNFKLERVQPNEGKKISK